MQTQRNKASFLVGVAFCHTLMTVGCGAGFGESRTSLPTLTQADASILSPDVVLLGLPTLQEISEASDAGLSQDAEPVADNGELIVPMHTGNRAPFNGVLFNGPAAAGIQVNFSSQAQRCVIDRNHDAALYLARYNHDIASLELARDTILGSSQVILTADQSNITRLNSALAETTRLVNPPHIQEGLIWAGAGMLLGAILVGGLVVFINAH